MLIVYNNGKEKDNSFVVRDESFEDIMPGVGRDMEEAFQNYKYNFDRYIKNLMFYFSNNLKIENVVEGNCYGEPLTK